VSRENISFSHVYPVLFHIGPLLVPSYGMLAAIGVLSALGLLLRTARLAAVNPNQLWNLSILALCAALAGSRILLVALNWTSLRTHPAWLLSLAMIHHPLLAGTGVVCALAAALPYGRAHHLPPGSTADALAAPVCLGLAFEQVGAMLAGSGYGSETSVPWGIVYTHPLAARWSGAPLFVPVHPVQIYAALAFFAIATGLHFSMPRRRQNGDIAGIGLTAVGAAIYFIEFWRDPEGRGSIFDGAIDMPQIVAVVLVLAGAFVLRKRKTARTHFKDPAEQPATEVELQHE